MNNKLLQDASEGSVSSDDEKLKHRESPKHTVAAPGAPVTGEWWVATFGDDRVRSVVLDTSWLAIGWAWAERTGSDKLKVVFYSCSMLGARLLHSPLDLAGDALAT